MEALTPVQIERKLRQLVNDLGRTQVVLAEARDAEVDARHEFDRARRRALLSGECPGHPGGWTVAEQTAWVEREGVEREVEDLEFAARKATVIREAAQDRLWTLLAQAKIVRSIGASVRQADGMARCRDDQ